MNNLLKRFSGTLQTYVVTLGEAHHIEMPDREKALHYLLKIGPMRIVEYARAFNNRITDSVTFDDVLEVYKFDRNLRLLVLDALERIEVSIRSEVDHSLQTQFGTYAFAEGKLVIGSDFREKLDFTLRRPKQTNEFAVNPVGYTPKCADAACHDVIKSLSFGMLGQLFGYLPVDDQIEISRQYETDEDTLKSCLRSLTSIRNIAAHHDRLWNVRLITKPKVPGKIVKERGFIKDERGGNDTLYCQITIIYFLLRRIARNTKWHTRLYRLVESGRKDFAKLNVLHEMGFPDDWEKKRFWNSSSPIVT